MRSPFVPTIMRFATFICLVLFLSILGPEAAAQGRGAGRAPLFFSETWQQTPEGGEHPLTQQSVANPNLTLKLYGEESTELQLTGAADNPTNPIHVWSGLCPSSCALAFRHSEANVDLSGLARIRWNTKMSGFHQIRPIVKLADGTWLIGDHVTGSSAGDYLIDEFSLSEVRWLTLDIDRVVTVGTWVPNPDLTNVEEVGFADLMPGSGHGAGGWVDVADIEVYGRSVPRTQ